MDPFLYPQWFHKPWWNHSNHTQLKRFLFILLLSPLFSEEYFGIVGACPCNSCAIDPNYSLKDGDIIAPQKFPIGTKIFADGILLGTIKYHLPKDSKSRILKKFFPNHPQAKSFHSKIVAFWSPPYHFLPDSLLKNCQEFFPSPFSSWLLLIISQDFSGPGSNLDRIFISWLFFNHFPNPSWLFFNHFLNPFPIISWLFFNPFFQFCSFFTKFFPNHS